MRIETESARQARVDWKEFGKQVVDVKSVKLHAFIMVLGYSREESVRFTTSMDMATLLCALAVHYGSTPKRCRARHPETKGKVERTI